MLTAALLAASLAPDLVADVTYDFVPETLGLWAGSSSGPRNPAQVLKDGALLVTDGSPHVSIAALPPPAKELVRKLEFSWKTQIEGEVEGMGFVWLPSNVAPSELSKVAKAEEPSAPRAFGLGIDASDPWTDDPFRGSGNIHHRPEHEISLHWDGREIVKARTRTDFRTGGPREFALELEFVPGGAEVTARVADETVFDRYFIAGLEPYVGRPVLLARGGDRSGTISLDDLRLRLSEPTSPAVPPTKVVVFDKVRNDKDHHENSATVELPKNLALYSRIVATLELAPTPQGIDPWDRLGRIWVLDGNGEKWEILRYITPYRKGWVWKVDVTDFAPLLSGKAKFVQDCPTYAEGWLVSVDLDYYVGPTERRPYRLARLWSGQPDIGDPKDPVSEFYVDRTVRLDPETSGAKVRIMVTGHGMYPNSQNAAEFMPIGRTLRVNGATYRNRLWKTDNYLNPCRPQSGTWKYDRAGWAPGDVVQPWVVDVSELALGKDRLEVSYELDPYVNENKGKTWAPFHATEAYVVLYRKS